MYLYVTRLHIKELVAYFTDYAINVPANKCVNVCMYVGYV